VIVSNVNTDKFGVDVRLAQYELMTAPPIRILLSSTPFFSMTDALLTLAREKSTPATSMERDIVYLAQRQKHNDKSQK
jgi:hypothetical protein